MVTRMMEMFRNMSHAAKAQLLRPRRLSDMPDLEDSEPPEEEDGDNVPLRRGPLFRHQEPPTFSGEDSCWSNFFTKFEAVANWNGWNVREQAASMRIHLTG